MVSIMCVIDDSGKNQYVRLTDDVYEDELEMGMVYLSVYPPLKDSLEAICKSNKKTTIPMLQQVNRFFII